MIPVQQADGTIKGDGSMKLDDEVTWLLGWRVDLPGIHIDNRRS